MRSRAAAPLPIAWVGRHTPGRRVSALRVLEVLLAGLAAAILGLVGGSGFLAWGLLLLLAAIVAAFGGPAPPPDPEAHVSFPRH